MKKVLIVLTALMLLTACGGSGSDDGLDSSNMKGMISQLERQLTVGMQLNADSVLGVIDSLQSNGYLPLPIADYERGTCYALQEKRRIAEYYYQKSLDGGHLFDLWPEAFYRASTNLAIMLSGKNDEQGAIRVATQALERLQSRSESGTSRWESALHFNIGSSQLRLGYTDEGLASLRQSLDGIRKLATEAGTAENLRTWATLSVNTATVVSNTVPDKQETWLQEAEAAVKMLATSREVPPALTDMLHAKVAALKALFYVSQGRTEEAQKAYAQYKATDYAKMPTSLIEQLTYLEKSGRWEEAARLLPDIWQLHEEMGTLPDIDYMSDLAEGYRVNRLAKHDREALEVGDRMAAMVDSVRKYFREDAAAELAVIYNSEQQKEQIFQQQWRLRRQQGAAVALFLTLTVVALVVYIIFRRRSAHQLKAANDRLNEANDQLHQRNEELTIANERAEESSRMKTKFIQQISHEIRTPLNILSGFTQVVTTPGIELADEEKADISQRITENTDRITQLVNKMLELSEADAQTVIPQEDVVNVAEIAAQAADVSGIRLARHLDFTMTLQEGTADLWIKTSQRYAVKALAQLLDNAKKFTRPATEGDNLTDYMPEEKEKVRLVVCRKDKYVWFIVDDTGCGVPPEETEHIFEEFVQLNEFYEGTGIGLSVARSIARRLGGDIWLEHSRDGSLCAGARFIMTLSIK